MGIGAKRSRWVWALCVLACAAGGLSSCGGKAEKRHRASALVDVCLTHYVNKDYALALQNCLDAKESDAKYPEVYNAIGGIYLAQRRYPEAIENFTRAIEIKEDFSEARTNLGVALHVIGRVDDSIAEFKKALQNDLYRNRDIALFNLCEAYLEKKELATAADYCKQIIEQNRAHCYAHHKLGVVYKEMNQPRSAVDEMSQAIKYCPTWTAPLLLRAELRVRLKETPQACGDYWDVLDAAGDDADTDHDREQARKRIEQIKCRARPKRKVDPKDAKDPKKTPQSIPYAR